MSTGYNNNNYGNINYYGTDWEGATGYTYTADGEKNIVFANPIYGIRALMVVISNKIKNGYTTLITFLKDYSPYQSEDERYKRAVYIANNYFNTNVQGVKLDLGDDCIERLSKGIIATEIPEFNSIPQTYYDVALRYLNSGNDNEAATFTNQTTNTNNNSNSLIILIAAISLGAIWYFNKK